MVATLDDVNRWIKTAEQNGDKYVISVCDTFDWDDYPVYCRDDKDLAKKRKDYDNVNMQRINEIIDLSKRVKVKK